MRFTSLVLLALLAPFAGSLWAQSPSAVPGAPSTLSEVPGDVPENATTDPASISIPFLATTQGGAAVPDLAAGDLEIILGGKTAPAQGILDPSTKKRVVIYLEQTLSSAGSTQRAVGLLAATARVLTELGPVEVISADPVPRTILPPTEDPTALDAALNQAALNGEEQNSLRTLRDRFFQRLLYFRGRPPSEDHNRELTDLVAEAVQAEEDLLTRQQDFLLSWLAEDRGAGHRVLILATDGFALEPSDFYLRQLPEATAETVRANLTPSPLATNAQETARNLSALGWTVLALAPASKGEVADAPRLEYDRFKESASDTGQAPTQPMFSVTLERLRRRLQTGDEDPQPQGPLLLAPQAPLSLMAEATGGSVVNRAQDLVRSLEHLEGWRLLQTSASRDGLLSTAVRSRRGGLEVRSPAWVSANPPEAVATSRARRLLAGDGESGSVVVSAAIRREEGGGPSAALESQADLIARAEPGRIRITVAPGSLEGPSSLEHVYQQIASGEETWSFRRELQIPAGADRIAVLVEDLRTGAWGGTLATLLEGSTGAGTEEGAASDANLASALAEARFLPRARPVRVLPPKGQVLRGRVRFQTIVQTDESVARMVFLLDGKEVAVATKPPYSARVQLGPFPQPRTLRVVAYGADGAELGWDSLAINEVGGSFRVRIMEPEPGRRTGPVNVEADVDLPVDRRLNRVDISWNDRRVATLYGPPFRHRVDVPENDPAGFIRVVAYLDDGRMAEDVVFLNEQDFAERVRVRLVELYTVVTDREGRPVRDLDQEQFVVREEGQIQEISEFNDAGDLPITMALNVDSSASMFVKLPAVQQAAGDFVRGFLSGRDQALLVDFDTEPRLARELTNNLSRVVTGIEQLKAGGDTHLWESIVYSLVELQTVPGKKAVIVFSDGAHEEEALSYRVCYEFARRLGIPVYLIVLHPGIARGDDLTSSTKTFTRKLDRLAEDTGGSVYYIPNTKNLDAIYRQIDTELRSQYLLAYYAESDASDNPEEWRKVEVEVKKKGLKARTISGYFPRW